MPRGVPKNRERPAGDGFAEFVVDEAMADSAMDATGEPATEAEEAAPALIDDPVVTLVPGGLLTMGPAPADPEPTPEQRRIKDLENQLALERGRSDPEPALEEISNSGDEGNILIHFLEDGLSALGRIWYRGQELEFVPGSQAHKDTFDRLGRSWLDLRNDEFGQVERWGKVMFRVGPWPGKSLRAALTVPFSTVRDEKGRPVPPPTEEELVAAEKNEAKRRRAAPKLSAH